MREQADQESVHGASLQAHDDALATRTSKRAASGTRIVGNETARHVGLGFNGAKHRKVRV